MYHKQNLFSLHFLLHEEDYSKSCHLVSSAKALGISFRACNTAIPLKIRAVHSVSSPADSVLLSSTSAGLALLFFLSKHHWYKLETTAGDPEDILRLLSYLVPYSVFYYIQPSKKFPVVPNSILTLFKCAFFSIHFNFLCLHGIFKGIQVLSWKWIKEAHIV